MKVKILIALKSFEVKQLSRIRENCRLSTGYGKILTEKNPKRNVFLKSDPSHSTHKAHQEALGCSLVSIALPKTQSNYTVLRSPHIDKKSRDQFELKIHKQLIIISTEIKQIREKLFNLKFHEMPGVQMKVVFQTKTRLSYNNESTTSPVSNFQFPVSSSQ
jgi:ribosomal protein S10